MKHFILLALLVATAANIQRHKHGAPYSLHTKPGTEKNKLFAEYGTNFRYVTEVKNGLDRVTVVTSIPIPKYVGIDSVISEFFAFCGSSCVSVDSFLYVQLIPYANNTELMLLCI